MISKTSKSLLQDTAMLHGFVVFSVLFSSFFLVFSIFFLAWKVKQNINARQALLARHIQLQHMARYITLAD